MTSAENDVPRGFVDGDPLLDEILADTAENDALWTLGFETPLTEREPYVEHRGEPREVLDYARHAVNLGWSLTRVIPARKGEPMSPAEKLTAAAAELRGLPVSSGRWGGQFAEALADWLEDTVPFLACDNCTSSVARCRTARVACCPDCAHAKKALKVADLILPADSDRAAGQGQVTA